MNDQWVKLLRDMFEQVDAGKCPFCKKPVDPMTFKDEKSLKEFSLSGLCQICQDDFFDNDVDLYTEVEK